MVGTAVQYIIVHSKFGDLNTVFIVIISISCHHNNRMPHTHYSISWIRFSTNLKQLIH